MVEIIQLFEDQKIQETTETDNCPFAIACETGNVEIINRCIENEEYTDNYLNIGLVLACEIGYITVVDRLLQDKRVNPSFNYNSALFEACQHGHIAIVDLLLQDKRVDPNSIYRFKKNNNQTKIINRLQQEIKNRGKVKQ